MGKQWLTLFFGGSKIIAVGDYSHEIKRCLLLGRKVMTNLDSILKSRELLCQQRSIWSRLWFFQWSCMDVRVGLWRKLSTEKLMLSNCDVGEDSWGSLPAKEIQPVHPKGDQSWVFIGRTDAEAETPILWTLEKTLGGGEGDNRGWDGWMASLTRWAWVWVHSGSWWWAGRPGVLQFMGLQRVGHDWVTELNWSMLNMECGRVVVASSEEIWNASILIRRRVNEINVGKNEVH